MSLRGLRRGTRGAFGEAKLRTATKQPPDIAGDCGNLRLRRGVYTERSERATHDITVILSSHDAIGVIGESRNDSGGQHACVQATPDKYTNFFFSRNS
jgi:hypothetical protein